MTAEVTDCSSEKIVGLVLAGGQARRMGAGVDKAFLSLAGRPLIAHVLERFAPQVGRVVISASGDLQRFATFGLPVFADLRSGFQGPLSGVETAFVRTEASWILSVAVDLPFLPHNLAETMLAYQKYTPPGGSVVAMSANRCHYVVCLWPRLAMEKLLLALENRQLCLRDWFRDYPHQKAVFSPIGQGPDPFFNINRPVDLQVAEGIVMLENGRQEEGV